MTRHALSDTGLHFLKNHEGLRLCVYKDAVGKNTIGYGHLMGPKEQYVNNMCSLEEAEALLVSDLKRFENAVNDLVHVPLNQNQYDALVAFTFNVGVAAFSKSTLLALLNHKDYEGAAKQFDRWVNGGGKRIQGLVNRRKAERELFERKA